MGVNYTIKSSKKIPGMSFNSRNGNGIHRNTVFYNVNRLKNYDCDQVLNKRKDLYRDKNKLNKLKFFPLSNYQLEDLFAIGLN